MVIVIFYCYMINDWEQKLKRQINKLVSSGLYEGADQLHLYVSDPENKQKELIESVVKDLPKINLNYTNINHGEGVRALNKVSEVSKEGDHKILYFHTKGVFNKYKNFETKEINDLKLRGVECWVDMMEYFLIENWKHCVEKLDENDIVGVTCHSGWWWGNFFWVRSSHINKLCSFNDHYTGSRWTAESWLHDANPDKENTKTLELHHFTYDPYYSVLPKYFYDNSVKSDDIKVEVVHAEYGWFAEQRDEGRPPPSTTCKTIDVTEKTKIEVENNNFKLSIEPNSAVCGLEDPAFGFDKQIRIKFKTNIDPENEYIITSFCSWKFIY